MYLKKLSEEKRFMLLIVSIILIIPLLFYLFGLLTDDTPSSYPENKKMSNTNPSASPKSKEKTVIVTEAGKIKTPPKAVADNIRDAIRQGNHSTTYMSVNKMSQESQEDEKILKTLAEMTKKQPSGIRKEEKNSRNPVRYFDESTPRDRASDAFYVYLVEVSGAIWPKLCIQSVGKRPPAISGFRIKADGKTFTLTPSAIKTEKIKDIVCQYYDAPIDQQSYAAVQVLLKSRKASLVFMEKGGERTRDITETEIKGLNRILETYAALGGRFEFINTPGTGKEGGKRTGKGK